MWQLFNQLYILRPLLFFFLSLPLIPRRDCLPMHFNLTPCEQFIEGSEEINGLHLRLIKTLFLFQPTCARISGRRHMTERGKAAKKNETFIVVIIAYRLVSLVSYLYEMKQPLLWKKIVLGYFSFCSVARGKLTKKFVSRNKVKEMNME